MARRSVRLLASIAAVATMVTTFAACGNKQATTDENGTLRVQKLWNGTASIIGPGSVHAANIQVKYLDPVSAVAVTEHQYIAGTEDVTLFEGTAQQGDVIEFDEPAHTLAAEGFTNAEISEKMFISERTVKAHISSAADKLCMGRVQMARLVERADLPPRL